MLLDELNKLEGMKKKVKFQVKGKVYYLLSLSKYSSINMYPETYYKMKLSEHANMFYIPESNDLYFAPKDVDTSMIKDNDIGKELIEFDGKKLYLSMENDYQFVLRFIYGDPILAEGDCRFYDYISKDGKYDLSLGWTYKKGKKGRGVRDDVYAHKLAITDLKIIFL